MTKTIDFYMSTELIKKMLQGLEIQFVSDDVRVMIHPPQKGIFFTHEEIKKIENADPKWVRSTIREIVDEKFSR